MCACGPGGQALHFFLLLLFNVIHHRSTPWMWYTVKYQNGAYFTGIKIFNKLPLELNQLVELPQKFKRTLRGYLVSHCFYSLDEFYSMNG
jgi:hypothetical protein